ncbi:MAG TPA: sulfotransferase [Rhodanobacteraceae bacterium]|nr:sulfotransferase [Rhodanobacteraceae bacterium]
MTNPPRALDGEAQTKLACAGAALKAGKLREADALVRDLAATHPAHPQVLHLLAGVRGRAGDHAGAVNAVQRALVQHPDDAALHCTLGVQLAAAGRLDDALAALQRACELQPGLASAWYNLGVLSVRAVRFEAAEAALRKAVELAPGNLQAQLQLAALLASAGRVNAAAAAYRAVLTLHAACGDAWWGLATPGNDALDDNDISAMQAALRDARASERDRVATGFAIARALDAKARYVEAMGVLKEAHAHAGKLQRWDAGAFTQGLAAILTAFATPAAATAAVSLGHGVIFIVSLPRSGSTLVEQMLASHSRVEGSGELHDLPQVLMEESKRRGRHYPDWVGAMDTSDWQRLGERYLERTERWRRDKPYFTDKLPGNWMHVGAIRAMLPGARIVVCRRDPVETCFACYRQFMTADGQGWTHRLADLGAYWNDFERAVQQWLRLFPGAVREQSYEALINDTENEVRGLLAFCGLDFEQACLHFHQNPRAVRSPSAPQVREPLRRDTARAARYGALLDPLRDALGFVDIMSAH